ncbi:MAG: primosomal protein N' [Lachnospiraceae bacterium]|nr:primosomal protein N' [Lachnospiraceae bacterium]
MFARVIIDISHVNLDRTFEYRIPEELSGEIAVGTLCEVPFGNADKVRRGYVVELTETPEFDPDKCKDVLGPAKGSIPIESHLIRLAWWMHRRYGSTMNDALRTVIPVREEVRRKVERTLVPAAERAVLEAAYEEFTRKHRTARARLLGAVLDEGELSYEKATGRYKVTAETVRVLIGQGLIAVKEDRQFRGMLTPDLPAPQVVLSDRQRQTADGIIARRNEGDLRPSLIHGITGSGKTEVYLELIRRVVAEGGQAICLIPEIALTYQTVSRFRAHFGDRVSVLHSRMSRGERFDQYERAKAGEIDVMIGPRSALFTPFSNLSIIIIDEEHEASYKSENPPKYHAVETAGARAGMCGAMLVLGSATPSVESYRKAVSGEYVLYRLPERAGAGRLPQVYIEDLREELAAGNRSIFSRRLRALMEDRLKKGQQIMLFLNRRGYAGFASCRSCGEVIRCPHCDVSLKAHYHGRAGMTLECHYCGYKMRMPEKCPACGSSYLGVFGLGTEKAEELTRKEFPKARILRMDLDTTSGKEGHRRILEAFAAKEADILIGTQMIVKGHDFPDVTLVGILAADLSLNDDDYRSAERTFQLVCQAAGRAGRGRLPGEAVIQSYRPDHYSLTCAAAHDYEAFYEEEIAFRKRMHYPPSAGLMAVLMTGSDEKRTERFAAGLAARIRKEAPEELKVLGPTKGAYGKLKDIYRQVIYLKHPREEVLGEVRRNLEILYQQESAWQDVRLTFDLNPVTVY